MASATAVSQFKTVTNENELQLHLPFESDEPLQVYCEAKQMEWPLTEADFRLFEAEAKAGNMHATSNLGLYEREHG
jgi:hypothetical protein